MSPRTFVWAQGRGLPCVLLGTRRWLLPGAFTPSTAARAPQSRRTRRLEAPLSRQLTGRQPAPRRAVGYNPHVTFAARNKAASQRTGIGLAPLPAGVLAALNGARPHGAGVLAAVNGARPHGAGVGSAPPPAVVLRAPRRAGQQPAQPDTA